MRTVRFRPTRRALAGAVVATTVAVLGFGTLRANGGEVGSADAGATDPFTFTSMDVGFAEGGAPPGMDRLYADMDTYVGDKKPIVRIDMDWWYLQPERCTGCEPHWDRLDPLVDNAAARGMRVLLVLAYAPPWATGHAGTDKWFPTDDGGWTSIIDQTVARYRDKIQAYEVWNEPNQLMFGNYGGGTDVERKTRYWQLVRLAYERVHGQCPNCVVLAGGSAYGEPSNERRNDNEPAAWLEWGYAHGYAPYFDAVAHHPYPPFSAGLGPSRPECTTRWWNMFGPQDERCGELAAVRAVMVRHGDAATKIWGTEWGYPTGGNARLGTEFVRDNLLESVEMWRSLAYTGPLFLHSYRDAASWDGKTCEGQPDNAECHFGVVDMHGVPKEPVFSDLSAKLTDTWRSELAPDGGLRRWAALRSTDGRFTLWLQGDGNVVLYKRGRSAALWESDTSGGAWWVNQTDGNVVLYDVAGKPLWESRTWSAGPCRLILQNDGNLVLYRLSDGKPVWHTNTWQYA